MRDEYTRGWEEADEAIHHKLPGHKDFSQGDHDWDRGWNTRLEQEEELKCEI